MMRTINLFGVISLAIVLTGITSCSDDDSDPIRGVWERRSAFEGLARSGAVSFTINDQAYVGLGFDGSDYLTDFWRYDPVKNTWYSAATFPGEARSAAVAFSANGKGYVGTGYNGNVYFADFWEYDPQTDTWTGIDALPATALSLFHLTTRATWVPATVEII